MPARYQAGRPPVRWRAARRYCPSDRPVAVEGLDAQLKVGLGHDLIDSAAGDLVGQGEHLSAGGGELSGEGHVPIDPRPGGGVQIEGLPAAASLLPQPHVIMLDAEHLLDAVHGGVVQQPGLATGPPQQLQLLAVGGQLPGEHPAIIVTAVTGCQFGNDDGGMLTGQLAANREQLELLGRARREPWLLDDATVDRVKKVFGVQHDDMWLWEETGRRWQALDLDTATRARVDGYMSLAAQFATTSTEVLALADEIAGGTINKVMAKSDLELGIEALHRDGPI